MLIAVAGLLLVTSQLNIKYAKWVGWLPNNASKAVRDPVSQMLNGVSLGIVGEDRTQLVNDDQQSLKEQLALANALNNQLALKNLQLERDLEDFRVISSIVDLSSLRFVQARVADVNYDRASPSLEIDRGSRVGIAPDQAVVVSGNLLGFVSEAGPLRSSVRMINTPKTRLQVRLRLENPPRDRPERLSVSEQGDYFFCDVELDCPIKIGSSAIVADSLFEQANGFVIGRVDEIIEHPSKPLELKRVIVRPVMVLGRQRRVTVLVPVSK